MYTVSPDKLRKIPIKERLSDQVEIIKVDKTKKKREIKNIFLFTTKKESYCLTSYLFQTLNQKILLKL